VFAGFFVGVPKNDPVRSLVRPFLDWINGRAGVPPYAWVLDATVALGQHASQAESIVAVAAGASAAIAGWCLGGFVRPRSRFLVAMAVGVVTRAVVALYA
jgi:hypothetical protein